MFFIFSEFLIFIGFVVFFQKALEILKTRYEALLFTVRNTKASLVMSTPKLRIAEYDYDIGNNF